MLKPLQSALRIAGCNKVKEVREKMGQIIGTIMFVVIALVILAALGTMILWLFGMLLWLVPLLLKLAFWGALIYFVYWLVRKVAYSTS